MNAPASSSSASSSASSTATSAAGHDASTSSVVFVPPPLPAFLVTPCRPGFQIPPVRHPSTIPCTPPPPRPKFRRFAWSKIPASRVQGRNNVWTTSDRLFREFKLDFERIEELFSVVSGSHTPPTAPTSPSASTGVKYPASTSAAGLQESSSRGSVSAKPQSSEVSRKYANQFVIVCLQKCCISVSLLDIAQRQSSSRPTLVTHADYVGRRG